MLKKFRVLAAAIIVLTAFQVFGEDKPRIAVLDLQAASVRPDLAVSVTDILTTEMVNTGRFEVVERMQVSKILNEQGFQQTGVSDSSKAAEVGKLLNTKRVIIGTVGKIGTKFIINIKIVNVEKASIEFAEKETAVSEDALVDACEDITGKLVQRIWGIKYVKKENPQQTAQPKVQPQLQPQPVQQQVVLKKEEKKVQPKKEKKDDIEDEKDPVRKDSKKAMKELDNM